jgi:hypothetical protein
VIIHAAATVHQDQDFGAPTYARNLCLWFSRACKGYHRAEYGYGGKDSPQPARNLTERISR